ncbi:hypothetical protein AAC387_Pa04g0431 [Persea americana]
MRSEKEIAGGSAIESPPSKELELRKSEVDLGFLRVGLKEGIGGGCIYGCATEAEASASDERERERVCIIQGRNRENGGYLRFCHWREEMSRNWREERVEGGGPTRELKT